MDDVCNMQNSALKRETSSSSLSSTLENSGLSTQQAIILERAYANLRNFDKNFWIPEFIRAGFTREQAETIASVLAGSQ